uniref:CDC20/Fizzy WD40 domain-containing protein n=1 Tax=Leersia perrieri TaxID=77586 RepID=A0A0D9VNV7_9ORYZ
MDHHQIPPSIPPPAMRSPMENSAAASTKPPTPSSTPSSRLAAAPSSRLASAPPHPSPSSAAPSPASRTVYSDRFIPSRSGSNLALFDLAPSPPPPPPPSPSSSHEVSPSAGSTATTPAAASSSPYCALLRAALFGGPATPDRVASSASACSSSSSAGASPVGSPATGNIFRFKAEVPRNAKRALFSDEGDDGVLFPGVFTTRGTGPRKIPRSPYKVLDAPALQDDFYLNLVDWSSHNILAVGLGNCVYLWNACSSKVTKLCDLGVDDNVCSVGWAQRGTHLAVGTNQGKVQVCGLKWSYDNRQLASGGNDNRLYVWNQYSVNPVLKYTEHTAAVKAIAWSPHLHGLLASGGGTADRCIRFWNTTTNMHLNCVDTGSQVCNLVWSKNVNELVSTHGYSQNQIIVWRYPTMSKLATLTGHTYRVLYLAISPDGQTIVTGAGDETLRFWNVFPSPKSQSSDSLSSIGATSFVRSYIR